MLPGSVHHFGQSVADESSVHRRSKSLRAVVAASATTELLSFVSLCTCAKKADVIQLG